MNILLINYEFPPIGAGASTATWHIGKELVEMGHKVAVLTSCYKGRTGYSYEQGMHVHRCPAIRRKKNESNMVEMMSFVGSACFFIPNIIRKYGIEGSIIFFSFPCGPLGGVLRCCFKIPYIMSLRGGDVPGNEHRLDKIHKVLTPLRRMVYCKSLAVVANSPGLKELAVKADPYPIRVIPNGIDTSFFKPAQKKRGKDEICFMFAGRLSEQKNLFFMLEQISKLKQRNRIEIKVHMAGEGPAKLALQEFARQAGLTRNIRWHGWVEKKELLKLYQRSDCFINPSFCEGMPNSVLEAMACGLPVIASDVPGNDALVINGKTGFLFHIHSHDAFLRCLEQVVDSPFLCRSMGTKAYAWVRKHKTWQSTARSYIRLFDTSKSDCLSKVALKGSDENANQD